ncbi:MAG: hypothetical protein PHU46_09670 [Rhodocyclaceae bacterium]|nr:hypothetical protein [Rhodocyclaceae bacterium]
MMAVVVAVLGAAWVERPAYAQNHPAASAVIQSPTQVAFLQARVKEARKRFSREAAVIAGVPAEKILLCLPHDWRAGDPRYAIIPCVEKSRRVRLSPEEKQKIGDADLEMKAAIARARVEALTH